MGDLVQQRGVGVSAKFRSVLLILILMILGLVGCRTFFYRSDTDKGLERLRAAYKGQRPLEPRLTTGFEFASLRDLRGERPGVSDQSALSQAEGLLLEAARDLEDPRARHALGLFYLAGGKIEVAVRELDIAAGLAPDDPAMHSDAGAAYLERARLAEQAGNGKEFFVNANFALNHFNRALTLNENQLEAIFNKALILKKLTLAGPAANAWNSYLEKDPDSPWAAEAKENLARVQENTFPAKTNSVVIEDYLAAFRAGDRARAWEVVSQTKELVNGMMVQNQLAMGLLTATEEKDPDRAREMISAMKFLGDLERENSKDQFFIQLAEYYGRASEPDLSINLQAERAMSEGHKFILKEKFSDSLTSFEQAKSLFLKAGNKWESYVAEIHIAYNLKQTDKIAESNQRLAALLETSKQGGYLWISTVSELWYGGNFIFLGEFSRGIEANKTALRIARDTSNVFDAQRSLLHIAEQYRALNNPEAMDHVFEGLTYPASYYIFPRQRMRNLFFATRILYRFKLYDLASQYAAALVDMAENQLKDRWMTHFGLAQMGAIYGDLKKYPEALKAVEQSLKIAESLDEGSLKKRLTVVSLLALANLQRESNDCNSAIGNYREAIRVQEGMEAVIDKYELLRGQFLCDVTDKDDEAVKTSMPQVLQFLDANREKIAKESDRNLFFDNEQSVYDEATGYVFSEMHDLRGAFDYIETSRARSLLNLVSSGNKHTGPLSLSEIQTRMPGGVQMITYAVIKDKILIWYISQGKFAAFEMPADPIEIANRTGAFLEAIRSDDPNAARQLGKDLYSLLIGPVESMLEKEQPICIVADKSLFRLPFAAMVRPDGRYLIEDYPLIQAPSASIFIRETEQAAQKSGAREESVLSIGNPAFPPDKYSGLKDLPDAKKEAEFIASLYSPAKFLSGKTATKKQVSEELEGTDVIHFAGHYVPNQKSPLLSKLVLDEDLSVQEIMDHSLHRPRLIVLSGCETGVEAFYNGEGMIGAARAFMASDVPVVVATQWPVETRSAARLMTKFHFYRKKQGQTIPFALRSAQLDMLRETDSGYSGAFYWAGFMTIGGYSTY